MSRPFTKEHTDLPGPGDRRSNYAEESILQNHCQVIKKGDVYDWRDFCRHRAPIWYQAQYEKLLRACHDTGFQIEKYAHVSKLQWKQDHVWWQVINATKRGTDDHIPITYNSKGMECMGVPGPAAQVAAIIAEAAAAEPFSAKRRVQPFRSKKRKTDTDSVAASRKKKTKTDGAQPAPGSSFGDYMITEEEFDRALKDEQALQNPKNRCMNAGTDIALLQATEWFRSRIMAEVVGKVNTAWVVAENGLTMERQHRCALEGLPTQPAWVDKEKVPAVMGGEQASKRVSSSVPVADMLCSPTVGEWLPTQPSDKRFTVLPTSEKVLKKTTVEIAGLKFMVDLCTPQSGDTIAIASPRIWML